MSYGGMFAFGDLLLGLFIGGLFLIPTFFLVLVIRKSETAYTRYSQILLGLSLTAPISLGILLIPAVGQGNSFLGWFCMDRLFASPIVIAALVFSRLLTRFESCEAPDPVCVVGRVRNDRLDGYAVCVFCRPSRVDAQSRSRFEMMTDHRLMSATTIFRRQQPRKANQSVTSLCNLVPEQVVEQIGYTHV